MLKTIYILLILVFSVVFIHGKSSEGSYKLVYPRYIPQNSSFDISIITSNKYPQADKLEIYILPDEKLNLNKIELKSMYKNSRLNFSPSFLESYNTSAFKAVIDFSDASISQGTFFQVLFNFRAENNSNSSVKFLGIFKQGERVLGYLTSQDENSESRLITADFKFFKSQKNAGKVIQINRQSQFEISLASLPQNNTKNLLAEFWVKFNDAETSVLKIKSKQHPEIEFEIATNEFQMLTVNSGEQSETIIPYFTSRKSWYHIESLFSTDREKAYFYCNGTLFAKYSFPSYVNPADLNFKFVADENGKTYQLDLLRLVDFNNSIDVAVANSNYLNFRADSSKVISQFKFDSNDEIESDNSVNVISNNLQYVKSDAPIMARAPELNINLLNNSYELEWGGGDFKQADSYILEKSSNNSEYTEVVTIQADNANEKSYSYLDEKDESSEVIFYRVKQVNKDGSSVYSSQVKLGQGLMEPFTLEQNYPNPFNPKTSIDIELLEDTNIEVTVYNLQGSEIAKLYKGFLSKGSHKFAFDASEFPSGIYLYKVSTPTFSQTKKMILTK